MRFYAVMADSLGGLTFASLLAETEGPLNLARSLVDNDKSSDCLHTKFLRKFITQGRLVDKGLWTIV